MAETLSEFIRKQAQQQRVNTIGAANIVLDTVEQKPDEVAGALQLADEFARTTGGPTPPVPMVQEYGNVFRREIERRRNGTILSGAPRLADWVRDPVNAALAKDALQELSWFEGFARGMAATAERAGERLSQMGSQFMLEQAARRAADRRKSFGEILQDEKTDDGFRDMQGQPIETWTGAEYLGAFARWVDARYADLIGTDDDAAAAEYAARVKESVDALRAIPKSQIATEFEQAAMVEDATLGEALANFGSAFLQNPVGGLSWALETAGESAPQLAAAMATTIITRNPFAGAAVGATGSYLTERYTSPAEFFEEKGLDLSKPEDVQALLSDPKLMEEAANRGVIRGLVIGAFDALSMGVAGKTLAGNPLVEAIAQGASQAILGSAGEYTARVAAGQEIDWNEVIAEGLAELATTPIDMGIAGRKFVRQRKEAEKAEETRAKVEEVMGAAGSSVLRNRMPDKFREFLERATDGSEVESVFIDSERFVEYFQDMGVDPFAIADTLEGVGAEELRMATISGGDLKIPVATLATVIPGSGHEAFFIEQSRFDPDTMSPSLAAEFNAKVEELRQEAFELAEELRLEEERSRSFEQEIYDTMVSRLRVAGRSTNEATTAAALWVANYRTAAADEGLTLEEYLERYPLPQVRGEIPEGFKTKNVDALTRTLAEARSRRSAGVERRGRTLLEFISDYGGINDLGGELRARDAEVIKRGRGKKTLRLSRGRMAAVRDMFGGGGKKYGIDDVAQAAIEAGYMADNPVVVQYMRAMEQGEQVPDIGAALLDAIDEELRGNPQYSSHDIVDEDAIRTDEALDEIEEYLSRLGVGLDDPDDVIREAIERDQDERRREYGQDRENLIVQHNLTAANLIHADKMRGLAVPSLAISNVDYPLDNFGEITLLASPDLIDPRKDRASKVFDADVYSPRYPTVRYKIAKPAMNSVWKRLGKVSAELGHVLSGELDNGEVERKGLEAFRDSSAVQLEFLRSTGRNIELPQNTARTEYLTMVPELADMFVDAYSVANDPAVKEAVERAINLEIQKLHDAAPDIPVEEWRDQYYLKGEIRRSVLDDINQEKRVLRDPGVDRYAARRVIRDAVKPHADEFAKWVEDQFGDVIAGEQVMTETASGDRRYLPHTLDNVVKILRKKLRDGEGFNYGVGSIRSTVANQFKSVSAIKAARGRLIPSDDMKALKDEVDDEFVALAGKLGAYSDFSDGFGWLDTFSEQLKELAQRGPRAFKQYFNDLPDDLLQEAAGFLQKLANLPTEYFEAKLQRAVDLSEFKAAVIPTDAPQEVKNVLEYARVPVIEYDPKVTGARSAAIRRASMEHRLLFQSAPPVESEAFKRWFGDSKVVDADGKPLVVYHGRTGAVDGVADFDTGVREGYRGRKQAGAFFSANREYAESYADDGSVVPVYLSIQNPFITSENPASFDADRMAELQAKGFDGLIWNDAEFGEMIEVIAFDPAQIKSVNNRGTFDPNDPRIMYQGDNHPFAGVTREQFLGTPKITTDSNASTLAPKVLPSVDAEKAVAFAVGEGLTAKYHEDGAAVFDGDKVVASYNFGDTLVVDRKYRRKGIASELVYQWRMRYPDSKPATHRTKKSQAIQEQVWDRIQSELGTRTLRQGPRGSIQFPLGGVADGETIINLFQSANLSTFLHESGHYFLANLQDRAAQGSAVAQERLAVVREWWRSNADAVAKDAMRAVANVEVTTDDVTAWLDNGTTGNLDKDMALDIGAHEQWARAFEAYLMEGKAPSIELRSAFEKFRAWLISVYRYITGLNVNVTDDLRAVFDRMLATDEEIAKANERAGSVGPVFASAEAMGLTEDEYAAFLKLRSQSEDEAKARLLAETMAPIKREQEKWFKDERAKVRAEVEREINAWRQYRAIEWMGNRRWLGEGKPDALPDMRMSKDILVRRYGAGILKTLPRSQQTLYAVDGGLDPDDIAGWFGFSSGDEMIRAMEEAPHRNEAIEAETDKRMRELHGDPLHDGSVELEALDAVHNDKRGQWIATELEAVRKVLGGEARLTAKEARHTARQTIARMRVRDAMNWRRFLAAERKAAEEAADLGARLSSERYWENRTKFMKTDASGMPVRGDKQADMVARLYAAKRRQLINHALYMEARAVADEVEKAERFVAKLGKRSHREKIAGAGRREGATVDYLAAIDEILERYDFRRMSGRQEERRASLNDFVQAMIEAGRENELAIPDNVMRDAQRRPYKTLPVEELRGVIDSLKNIEHIALRWNKLIDEQRERDLDEAVSAFVEAYEENVRGQAPGRVPTSSEQRRDAGRRFLNLVLNADTMLREIDGFKDFGPAYENIKLPIDEAMNRLIERKEKATADLERLYGVYSKEERREMAVRKHVPALGGSFSKWELISIALNTGNEDNFQRLTDERVPGHFTEAQVNAALRMLDERDADFVQSVWDYLGTFRDDIAKRERRVSGVEPKWVEPSPVEIGGKLLRGGYYPLRYDPRLTDLSRGDAAEELAQSLQVGRFVKAQTRQGHLKERAQASGRAVFIDMSVLNGHINQVIYDLELNEPVANAWRILRDERVRSAFRSKGRMADYDALEAWLLDVGTGELRSGDFLQRMARTAKSNFTAAKLALNLSTALIQVTGVTQSMVVIGKKNFALGVQDMFRPGVLPEITAKSAFMRNRQTTFNKDIFDFYNDPKIKPYASAWGDIKQNLIGPVSFYLMTKGQYYLVDVPTWLGAYRQGLQKFGNDEAKAISYADRMVARAQASGLFSDRSAIERGSTSRTKLQSDVVRLYTALGSYMFAKFNVAYERAIRAGRIMREEGFSKRSALEALSVSMDMALLFTVEALLYNLVKGRLPDDDDDDDENFMLWLAKETGLSVLSTIPFVRDVASAGQGFEGGGSYGAITKELAAPFKQALQGEVDRALVKSIVNAAGIATGLPSTQINRAVDAAMRQAEGDDVSPAEYLLGRQR